MRDGTPKAVLYEGFARVGRALGSPARIELLNLLRPTVAVAEFLVWATLALAVLPRTRASAIPAAWTAGLGEAQMESPASR